MQMNKITKFPLKHLTFNKVKKKTYYYNWMTSNCINFFYHHPLDLIIVFRDNVSTAKFS